MPKSFGEVRVLKRPSSTDEQKQSFLQNIEDQTTVYSQVSLLNKFGFKHVPAVTSPHSDDQLLLELDGTLGDILMFQVEENGAPDINRPYPGAYGATINITNRSTESTPETP